MADSKANQGEVQDPTPKGEEQQREEVKVVPEQKNSDRLDEWKAASRKWEDRAKANKTELDSLTAERTRDLERITTLETENAALKDTQVSLLREAVASIKGVPAHRITGATREELEADADKFLEELNQSPRRGYVPTSGQGGEQPISSVMSGRERARESLGKS